MIPKTDTNHLFPNGIQEFDGKYLTVNLIDSLGIKFRISSWNHGLICQHFETEHACWIEEPGDSNFPFFLGGISNSATQEFIDEIPSNILEITETFFWNRLTLLRLLHEDPRVEQLIRDNPALIALFAETLNKREVTIETGVKILEWKRRDILGWILDSNSSNRLVKFISKFQFERLGEKEVYTLFRILKIIDIDIIFQHVKSFDSRIINIFFSNREMAECRFFPEIMEDAEREKWKLVYGIYTHHMGNNLGLLGCQIIAILPRTSSYQNLIQVDDGV